MRILSKLAVLFLAAVLVNCTSSPGARDSVDNGEAESALRALQAMLPGVYSDFAWHEAQGVDAPVTDLRIRQLKTEGTPVFLFEQYLRGQDVYVHDLYWLKFNRGSNQAELYFTRLAEDELSAPMQDTLNSAWQRVLPGCAMPLEHDGNRFTAATDPARCFFENPLQGQTGLSRRLSTDGDTMTIETGMRDADNRKSGDDLLLELQKHRTFRGWAAVQTEPAQQDKPSDWQLSQVFHLRDDGRLNHLYDQGMELLGFGLQLARLHRFDGEPAYYKLSVINLENGQTQAYQWFDPESADLDLKLDWFQANLAPVQPESLEP